ncbi:hypothetical protein OIDMADRAFT_35336 [Oidiodendron maius Zn]|uniref:Isochorismatase-like domain-containing protein n=1 Tax=Oidiodendron maius (strain Zn) TaxID=913774 RepID=A0A0C3GU10_OIDMZ|nr:hypothetical protein OIDMADRAFT_35336 [Oidiodendron maius Zn]
MAYPGRLTRDNAVLLIVDHQVGLPQGSYHPDLNNREFVGPTIPELQEVLHGIECIERTTVNAWGDPRIVTAVKHTGRKNIVVTGVSTDVCLAFPAMSALADGYAAYTMVDASGAFSKQQAEMGVMRMVQAGVIPVCYSNVAVEILGDNANPEANHVYSALSMPFAGLVTALNQHFSRK